MIFAWSAFHLSNFNDANELFFGPYLKCKETVDTCSAYTLTHTALSSPSLMVHATAAVPQLPPPWVAGISATCMARTVPTPFIPYIVCVRVCMHVRSSLIESRLPPLHIRFSAFLFTSALMLRSLSRAPVCMCVCVCVYAISIVPLLHASFFIFRSSRLYILSLHIPFLHLLYPHPYINKRRMHASLQRVVVNISLPMHERIHLKMKCAPFFLFFLFALPFQQRTEPPINEMKRQFFTNCFTFIYFFIFTNSDCYDGNI